MTEIQLHIDLIFNKQTNSNNLSNLINLYSILISIRKGILRVYIFFVYTDTHTRNNKSELKLLIF